MTLEKAIQHCEEIEAGQIAKWLRELKKLKEDKDIAIGMMKGNCDFCKNKQKTQCMSLRDPMCGIHLTQVAEGECSYCKYAIGKMIVPMNSKKQDQDNWEWKGDNGGSEGMHWIHMEQPYPRYECSNCGYSFTAVKLFAEENLYRFCPECGAKNKERRM